MAASLLAPAWMPDDGLGRMQRKRLLTGLAISVALHAALLTRLTWFSDDSPSAAPSRQVIEARLISATPSPREKAVIAPKSQVAAAPIIVEAPPPPVPKKSEPRPVSQAAEPSTSPPLPRPIAPEVPAAQLAPQSAPATATPPSNANAADYSLPGTLNIPPRLLEERDALYPGNATGTEGTVFVLVMLSSNGLIDDAMVTRSSPPGVFDESALAAVRGSRFAPGFLNGVAVKSQLLLELKYTVRNRGALMSMVQSP